MLAGIGIIEEIGYHGIEDGVTQEFKTLVVGPCAVVKLYWLGTVYHGKFIELDVTGIVACDVVDENIKLLILDEKELYE